MKTFKHSTLFILCTLSCIYLTRGQYHLEIGVHGLLPISSNAKGYKTGVGGKVEINRRFNESHALFIRPAFLNIPGEKINDHYLRYRHSPVEAFPLNVGYQYSPSPNFSYSIALGPTFYTQPERTTGMSVALQMAYHWRRFIIQTGLQRLLYKGHLDLFSLGLGYQLF